MLVRAVLFLAVVVLAGTNRNERLRVHWMAPFFSGGGYASEAIAFVRALEQYTDVPVSIDHHGDSINRNVLQHMPSAVAKSLQRLYAERLHPTRSVCVCHSEPGAWHPSKYPTTTCPPPGCLYRVGRTMFETDRLPEGWAERINAMDEIWVPTEFHRDIFARGGVEESKLHVLGEPVDTEHFDPEQVEPLPASIMDGTAPDEPSPSEADGSIATRFLSVFKWEYRKGWDVLLRAYLGAFDRNDAVSLSILTSAYHSTSDFAAHLEAFQRSTLACSLLDNTPDAVLVAHGGGDGQHTSATDATLPWPSSFCIDYDAQQQDHSGAEDDDDGVKSSRTTVSNATLHEAAAALRARVRRKQPWHLPRYHVLSRLSPAELLGAYRASHAFVLPSRGEGWGRPHVEAMAMGLPVLATNWSGPTAFLDTRNGYPVPYTHLRPVPTGPFQGHLMAEPSEQALAAAMRAVVEQPEEARRRGQQAREDMRKHFSPRVFAEQLERHVTRIEAQLGGKPLPQPQQRRAAFARGPKAPAEADEAVIAAIERFEEL